MVTGEQYEIVVPTREFLEYYNGQKLIQDAMPSVSAEDREFLISGTSPKGWVEVFSAEEDEDPEDYYDGDEEEEAAF